MYRCSQCSLSIPPSVPDWKRLTQQCSENSRFQMSFLSGHLGSIRAMIGRLCRQTSPEHFTLLRSWIVCSGGHWSEQWVLTLLAASMPAIVPLYKITAILLESSSQSQQWLKHFKDAKTLFNLANFAKLMTAPIEKWVNNLSKSLVDTQFTWQKDRNQQCSLLYVLCQCLLERDRH